MASFYNWDVTKFTWHQNEDKTYTIDNDFEVSFTDENKNKFTVKFKKGFKTDGGSIPTAFSWFAKGWSDDYKYNATFVMHDALYCSELLPKATADDLLRSSLRDCGMNRFHASSICAAVKAFAKCHYGVKHDKWNKKWVKDGGIKFA